jgi:two-component SAPR family response regulator
MSLSSYGRLATEVYDITLVLKSLGFSEVVVSADYEYGKRPSRADQTFTFEARRA